ncbi:hypothetical protein, partial [Streptomyces sp. URMC 123]|uniref:hypothetical protein n=1 Tax=Streptomyces sp. URMC 123 TaxID=3423403 RepID=UPI003F1944F1
RSPGWGPGWGPGDFANPYLCGALLYLALLFSPSGVWLLWRFPSWETMHAQAGLPGWLVAGFAATNVGMGVVGFEVSRRLLVRERPGAACAQLLVPYFVVFFLLVHGWDGTGYQRFLSTEPSVFRHFDDMPLAGRVMDWLTSDVARTLGGMGLVLIPALLALAVHWYARGARALGDADPLSGLFPVGLAVFAVLGPCLGAAVVAALLVTSLGWVVGASVVAAALAGSALAARRPFAACVAPLILPPIEGPSAHQPPPTPEEPARDGAAPASATHRPAPQPDANSPTPTAG